MTCWRKEGRQSVLAIAFVDPLRFQLPKQLRSHVSFLVELLMVGRSAFQCLHDSGEGLYSEDIHVGVEICGQGTKIMVEMTVANLRRLV